MTSTLSLMPEPTRPAIQPRMSDTSGDGNLTGETKTAIIVSLVLFLLLLLGFFLVAHTRRWSRDDIEAVLPVNGAARPSTYFQQHHHHKSPSTDSAQSELTIIPSTSANSTSDGVDAQDTSILPHSSERQHTHMTGKRSKSSAYVFSVPSHTTADSSMARCQVAIPSPPAPTKRSFWSSRLNHFSAYSNA